MNDGAVRYDLLGMIVSLDEPLDGRAEALPRAHRRGRPPRSAADEPPVPEPMASGRHGHVEAPRATRLPSDLVGVKVLVVDDDAGTLDYFSVALNLCGAVVAVAARAREALETASRTIPDAILTDIAMPGEDGYWLLTEIRRHREGALRAVPVLAATAYGREHPRPRTLAAGFADHLQKPVDPQALCAAIARAVGR